MRYRKAPAQLRGLIGKGSSVKLKTAVVGVITQLDLYHGTGTILTDTKLSVDFTLNDIAYIGTLEDPANHDEPSTITHELPCFGIVVKVTTDGDETSGTIRSNLHERDPKYRDSCVLYNAAMDGLESIILAHACAGIDVTSPSYIEGVKTAALACADNL